MVEILGSISFIALGIFIIFNPTFTARGGTTDLSYMNINIYLGLLLILIGAILLYKDILNKTSIVHSKCPKCKKSYNYNTLKNGICPKCDIPTIDLDIYFDKFPEEL